MKSQEKSGEVRRSHKLPGVGLKEYLFGLIGHISTFFNDIIKLN